MSKTIYKTAFKFIIILFIGSTLFSCKKCKECQECELNPNTGQSDKNCSEYKEYCGSDLKVREETDIFHCK